MHRARIYKGMPRRRNDGAFACFVRGRSEFKLPITRNTYVQRYNPVTIVIAVFRRERPAKIRESFVNPGRAKREKS